ncbi:MAG: hypothetical protein R6V03_10440 [Kiritimatiellia bacterium]
MIEQYLDDLESRIDPEAEDRLEAEWQSFTEGRFSGDIFSPSRTAVNPPGVEWPNVSTNHAQEDIDAMVLQQFGVCSTQLANGSGGLMTVRANYGTGIMPTLFGAKLFVMDESLNTLQTAKPLGADSMQELIQNGMPAMESGLGAAVLAAGKRFAEVAAQYPKIGRYVHIYHPDMQGPMDICEMLWGSEIFLDLLDRPDLVHRVLELLTDTYVHFMKAWNRVVGHDDKRWATHWSMMHAGKIMIRTDSGMNLSREMYEEFIRPYDQRLLIEMGGGAVHFCGRGSHYIAGTCSMDRIYAINLSQPHLNDMETIYRNTVDRGIKLLGFNRERAEKALAASRNLRGLVHCW